MGRCIPEPVVAPVGASCCSRFAPRGARRGRTPRIAGNSRLLPRPPRRGGGGSPLLLLALWLVAAATPATAGPPARIVSLAPATTEILFALGAGERVVGVSDYCAGPEAALALPRVGGYVDADLERIVALTPDLLVTVGRAERLGRFAAARRIAFRALTLESVADVGRTIRELGQLVGAGERGSALADALAARLAAVRRRYAAREPVATLLVLHRPPGRLTGLMTCNGESFLSELLTIAGGRNSFAGATSRYLNPGLERIVAAPPEVILELQPDTRAWAGHAHGLRVDETTRRRLIADWAALGHLPAVRNQRIVVLTQPFLLIPSIHLPEIAEAMAAALHPREATPAPPAAATKAAP